MEHIDSAQCTDEMGKIGCTLVGVVYDSTSATIYTTRDLTEDDIIHELLHVAHPEWPEEQVVKETDFLYSREMLKAA